MITPKFKITQTVESLTITINAPFAYIKDVEVFIDDKEVIFSGPPYYLRLYLDHEVIGNQELPISSPSSQPLSNEGIFDTDSGNYVLTVIKKVKGQHFPDLDMITRILTPHDKRKPKIEIINEDSDSTDSEESFSYKQEPATEVTYSGFPYGFARTKKMIFTKMEDEINLSIDLKDPDSKNVTTRKEQRIEDEKNRFSYEAYLYDYHMPDVVEYLEFRPVFSSKVELTNSENERLLKLPKKGCSAGVEEEQEILMGLIDLLLTFCYNHRINAGDECCEASWNYAKVSATLSWLDVFSKEDEVLCAFMRRSMTFPLFRNWELSMHVVKDTITLLQSGKLQILKCLLEMHRTFQKCDQRYILNELYLTQYCCWIQEVSNGKLLELAAGVERVKLDKDMVQMDLTFWEEISKADSNRDAGPDSDDDSSHSEDSDDKCSSSEDSDDKCSSSKDSDDDSSHSDDSDDESSHSKESNKIIDEITSDLLENLQI